MIVSELVAEEQTMQSHSHAALLRSTKRNMCRPMRDSSLELLDRCANTGSRSSKGGDDARSQGEGGGGGGRTRSSHQPHPGHCAPLRREGPRQLVALEAPGMKMRRGEGK